MRDSALNAPRPPYFANRVLRLAIKTALAQHCGTDAFALLCVIALTEDARRYRGPVAFFNAQLLPLVGFSKWDRLDRARQRLIDAGWLIHEPGGRHKPGLYRVAIPPDLEDVGDAPVDESSTPGNGYQEGIETGNKRVTRRGSRGDRQGEPSNLALVPLPSPDKSASRFAPPTIDEVANYCRERRNNIDPQRFVDFYTSNGWRVGKNPMRDWHASIRNWEKNDHGTTTNNAKTNGLAGFIEQHGLTGTGVASQRSTR